MRTIKLVLTLVIALVVMLIIAANMTRVDLHLVPEALGIPFFTLEGIPLALVIVLSVLTGIILGFLIEYARERRHRRSLEQKRREIGKLREENAKLAAKLGPEAEEMELIPS